jgi:hypothetical protein
MCKLALFQVKFCEVNNTSRATASIGEPCKRLAWVADAEEYSAVWDCKIEFSLDGNDEDFLATGETSLQAVQIAGGSIAKKLPDYPTSSTWQPLI